MTTAHGKSTGLWTRHQLAVLLKAWGFGQEVRLPRKAERLVLLFPPSFDLRVGLVTVHSGKSTDGEALYSVELTNDNKRIVAYSEV